jgi:hypothetical protein
MKLTKKILILILIIISVMQVVQPLKNKSEMPGDNDISKVYDMPEGLHQMLQHKCYDCHSNNTRYPWYIHIQPIGWILAANVHDGKEELNFSEFKTYSADRKAHKLEDISEVIEDGSMPLKGYTLLNKGTELTESDKAAINNWLKSVAEK